MAAPSLPCLCWPQLTLLFNVVLFLRDLGFVIGDAPDDSGLGRRPAPQVDLPLQGPLWLRHLGWGQGLCLHELDGVDLLGHGLLLQKPLFVLLQGRDTREGQVTGQREGGNKAAARVTSATAALPSGWILS